MFMQINHQPVRIVRSGRGVAAIALTASALALLGVSGASDAPAQGAALAQPATGIKSVDDVKSMLTPGILAPAEEITHARTTAKVGQTITVRGYVAMSKDAFSKDTASFIVVDESVREGERPSADALPDTSDAVPATGRAVIRIVNTAGAPLRFGLDGQHGLKPGAEVFVTGSIAEVIEGQPLVLNAVSMHVPRGPLPVGFFTDSPAAGDRDISEARKAGTFNVGDEVVLRGRVGGSKQPFVPGRAVFTLVGRGIKACNENPDDRCSIPWDYCCETKDDILANSVSVQVVDAKAQVLRTDMKGRRGIKELTEIVVVGKVVSAEGKAVVVNATAMHVVE